MASDPSQLAVEQQQVRAAESGSRRVRALSFALVGLLVGAGLALAIITYRVVQQELTAAATLQNGALARLASTALSERFDRMADLAASLATRVRFADLVSRGDWEGAAEILKDVPGSFGYVDRLFLADPDGVLRADVPPLPGVRGRSFGGRAWYQGLRRDWRTYVSPVYLRAAEPRHNVIAIATPVRRRDTAAVAGILVLQLSLNSFFDWARSIELGPDADLIVIDPAGQAAYRSGVSVDAPIADYSAEPGVARLREGATSPAVLAGASGEPTLYAADRARYGWGVVLRQPAAEAFAVRDQQLALVQLAYALFALLAGALGWIALRGAARRREQLGRARAALARHEERLRVLAEIDRAMVAEQPAEAIAAAVIRPLRELLGVPRAIVNRFDFAGGAVEWVAAAGRRRTHVGPGVRFDLSLMGDVEALRRGESQLVDMGALPESPETRRAARLRRALLHGRADDRGRRAARRDQLRRPGGRVSGRAGVDRAGGGHAARDRDHAGAAARAGARAGRRARDARAERTAELEAANKELEAFSYSVSHDLRAPLRAHRRLLAHPRGGLRARRSTTRGGACSASCATRRARMGQLIDDLLAFSRLGRQPMAQRAVDMRALAREVVGGARAGDSRPRRSRSARLPPARGDPRAAAPGMGEPARQRAQVQRASASRRASRSAAQQRRRCEASTRARQRRGLRHALRGQAVRRVPAPAPRGRVRGHRRRAGDRAAHRRAPRRARLGRRRAGRGRVLPLLAARGRT